MPQLTRATSLRAVTATLAVAIIGVLGLDTTKLVAAPKGQSTAPPTVLDTHALRHPGMSRQLRVLHWSGYNWIVWPIDDLGPEQTALSNSWRAVHVDSKGRLHLAITKVDGVWRSVELQLLGPVEYGTYRMTVDTRTARFDPWTVLGMFVYRPGSKLHTNEIDIEDSRYPHLLPAPDNAQFVVQPYFTKGNQYPFEIKPSYRQLWQQFTWLPGTPGNGIARFQTRLGTTAKSPLLARWSFQGYEVPIPAKMHLYLNLWMNKNNPPLSGTHSAVIDSFSYVPAG